MKLYRVKLRGMQHSTVSTRYGISYVVAEDPTKAYNLVKKYVDDEDLGFSQDREMESVELLAETGGYPGCLTQLFIKEKK